MSISWFHHLIFRLPGITFSSWDLFDLLVEGVTFKEKSLPPELEKVDDFLGIFSRVMLFLLIFHVWA